MVYPNFTRSADRQPRLWALSSLFFWKHLKMSTIDFLWKARKIFSASSGAIFNLAYHFLFQNKPKWIAIWNWLTKAKKHIFPNHWYFSPYERCLHCQVIWGLLWDPSKKPVTHDWNLGEKFCQAFGNYFVTPGRRTFKIAEFWTTTYKVSNSIYFQSVYRQPYIKANKATFLNHH